MKYFFLLFLAVLLYSCSDNSNPTNTTPVTKDSLIYSFDSISFWGNGSGQQSTGGYWTDTSINKIKVYFTGETDYDSSDVELILLADGSKIADYRKVGKTNINLDHNIEFEINAYTFFSTSFYVHKFGPGTPNISHITMKYIKVFKVF